MRQRMFEVQTHGQGLVEISRPVEEFVAQSGVEQGLLTLFVRHTSCSLMVQENADPDVQTDLQEYFHRLVPPTTDPSHHWMRHTSEGPDDMPGHIKAALNQVSLNIPIAEGRLVMGTWQGIFLFEHRDHSHRRQVFGHISL